MARNGKSISVKIATTKVIKALETRLAQLKRDKENQVSWGLSKKSTHKIME